MNLTDEIIEMWEQDARAGHCDSTAANARILALIGEHDEDTRTIAELTGRLCECDPGFRASVQSAIERRGV